MDILSVLLSSHSPLTLDEIREYSGAMFSADRLDSLLRSGEIKQVDGMKDTYWALPSTMKKSTARRCQSPMKQYDREKIIQQIVDLRVKLNNIDKELELLARKKDKFPTQAQLKEHMNRLHKYNDAKDIGQTLMGCLANMENVKIQQVYEEYGLDENE